MFVQSLRHGLSAVGRSAIAVAIVLMVFGIPTPASHADKGAPPGTVPPPKGFPANAQELPALRSARARTFRLPNGPNRTLIYAQSVNYRSDSGTWQPIDDTLVRASAAGYALENRANSYTLSLPQDLSAAPVKFSVGNRWVSYGLRGAHGRGLASNNTDRFSDALPATDVAYAALGDDARETLTLADASAPKSFSYELHASAGLTPKLARDGGVDFVDRGGKAWIRFLPPSVIDAAGAVGTVRFALAGSVLTVKPDRNWLASSARQWPVKIDPDVIGGSNVDVVGSDDWITSASPTANNALDTTDSVGWDGTHADRLLLSTGVQRNNLPSNAVVLDAQLNLYLQGESTTNSAPIAVYNATKQFDLAATWNTYDSLDDPWTTPGGDIDTGSVVTKTIGGQTGQAYSWDVTKLIQNEAAGVDAGGLIVKQQAENVNNVLQFAGGGQFTNPEPEVDITWNWGVGDRSNYDFLSIPLDDRMGLQVNEANGNLLLEASDLQLAAQVGLGASFGHSYNSLNSAAVHSPQWSFGPGNDTFLSVLPSGTIVYSSSTGVMSSFAPDGSGGYRQPQDGTDATLTAASGTVAGCSNAAYAYKLNAHSDNSTQYFDADGYLVAEVDLNGNSDCYSYDANQNLSKVVDGEGRTTTFTFDANWNLTQLTDPAGRLYKYGYDPTTGYLATYTDPAGGITKYGYNSDSMLSQITDPKGNITTITYDTYGRVKTIKRALVNGSNPTWTFTYNTFDDNSSAPFYVKVTDPNSHGTSFYYDSLDRVTKVTDPLGHSSSVDFTTQHGGSSCADSNPCSATDALENTTTFGYDATGESLIWSQSPTEAGAGDRPTFAYTNANHPYFRTRYTDPENHVWNYNYDETTGNTNGNLTSKTEGSTGQNPVTFTYNPNGTLASATDAKGKSTTYTYTYDLANPKLLTREVANPPAPLPASTTNYDSLGRVSSEVDGNGNTTSYTYDNLDRVTKRTYTKGTTTSTTSYVYDKNGNTTSMTDDTGTTTYTIDSNNRLTKEARPDTTSSSYAYDAAGNLTGLTDASGTTSYSYDAANELSSLTEPGGKQTTFGYNADGNRTTITYVAPNITGTVGYDTSQRITSITWTKATTTLASFTYCYQVGTTPTTCSGGTDTDQRQWVSFKLPGDAQVTNTTYGYDGLNRLASATSSGGATNAYSYLYDQNGNRTRQTVNGTSTYYLYNAANELCWSGATDPGGTYSCSSLPSGGKTYGYDGNGNMLSGSSDTFAYNLKNQTSTVTPTGGSAINMTYSGVGQAQRTMAGGTSYENDLLGVGSEGSTYYTRDADGTVLGERNPAGGSGSYYFLVDALGSVVAVYNATGDLADTFRYGPFGDNPGGSGWNAPVADPWRFVDGYYDAQTGLDKFGERYYDAALGRWTQLDAVNDPLDTQGWNRYTYAGQNPINDYDLNGTLHCGSRCGGRDPFYYLGQPCALGSGPEVFYNAAGQVFARYSCQGGFGGISIDWHKLAHEALGCLGVNDLRNIFQTGLEKLGRHQIKKLAARGVRAAKLFLRLDPYIGAAECIYGASGG